MILEKYLNRAFLAYVEDRNITEVKNMLECNININTTDDSGNTALMIACQYNNTELIKLLIDDGINLDAKNINGDTALIIACRCIKSKERVLLLINSKANLDLQNNIGYSAYKIAHLYVNPSIYNILVEAGAVTT